MQSERAIVAVLAGGRGSRMGAAKPAAELGGRPLIAHVLDAVADSGLRGVVLAKRDSELPELRVPVVIEPDEPRHPLCGVLAALAHAAPADVVLVGCDMPFLSGELLAWLGSLEGPALARLDGHAQPLPSRVCPGDRDTLAAALAREEGLGAALGSLHPRPIERSELERFGDPRRLCLSVDDRAGLARARESLAAGNDRS